MHICLLTIFLENRNKKVTTPCISEGWGHILEHEAGWQGFQYNCLAVAEYSIGQDCEIQIWPVNGLGDIHIQIIYKNEIMIH